ncbi:MAG TPA: sulfurtransferase TusA family protein [Thermoanaerobaculia bacterium]|nr:sulfurtransferase TusA family protein [Thermoanaerobaculia bacterium]
MSAPAPITRQLDVTGTFCPLPILLAAREMMRLAVGDRVEVIGDDPGILEDMPVWCERAGHRLLEMSEREGRIISIVEKGGLVASHRKRRGGGAGAGRGGSGGAGGGGGAGGAGAGGEGAGREAGAGPAELGGSGAGREGASGGGRRRSSKRKAKP